MISPTRILYCEVYDAFARGTRGKVEINRPKAVPLKVTEILVASRKSLSSNMSLSACLRFAKTSIAHLIGNHAGVPVVYVPVEIIMSKYNNKSEQILQNLFSLANDLPNGAIIFLIRYCEKQFMVDGSDPERKGVISAATNRKQDLDPALLSVFEAMIHFELPDFNTRQEIAARYAKHLIEPELAEFASATEQMSGRDIIDVCQQAEHNWASKKTQKNPPEDDNEGSLPPLQEYIQSVAYRL
ncbi:protease [Lithospermum erythrorhizon]|uniref:Protease n=1 Tax=Lithospermum erythrorhizon TaxID=34254 RepID=A0AAV3R6H2_LITER